MERKRNFTSILEESTRASRAMTSVFSWEDSDAWPSVSGQQSFHQESNDNGSRFLDFCALQQYVIEGTLFQHKDIHKVSRLSPKGDLSTQIDHINKRWRRSLLDVRSFRGADINTSHFLVCFHLRLKLSSNRQQTGEGATEKRR